MGRRSDFHDILVGVNGNENVYFQPTQNTRMEYPAIVYTLNDLDPTYANDNPYTLQTGYLVTHIAREPDSATPKKLAMLRLSSFDTKFEADGLNHTVFNIYY